MTPTTLSRVFIVTVATLLVLTAGLKVGTLIRSHTTPEDEKIRTLLAHPAPYLPSVSTGQMLWVGVGFELGTLVLLRRARDPVSRLGVVALAGGIFAAYHVGLRLVDYKPACGCLGSLAGWLQVSRSTYDALTLIIVGYMLVGSYGILLWERLRGVRNLAHA